MGFYRVYRVKELSSNGHRGCSKWEYGFKRKVQGYGDVLGVGNSGLEGVRTWGLGISQNCHCFEVYRV